MRGNTVCSIVIMTCFALVSAVGTQSSGLFAGMHILSMTELLETSFFYQLAEQEVSDQAVEAITETDESTCPFLKNARFSGTFESVYWDHDPDDWDPLTDSFYEGPYSSIENQLGLRGEWRGLFGEIRLRSMKYDNGIHYDYNSREYETDIELFKFTARYHYSFSDSEFLRITAGDFYKSLARGIVLYVQEDKELNLDRTIRGGLFESEFDILSAQVFGGEVTWYKFLDHRSENNYEQLKIVDRLLGGRVLGHFPSNINLGVQVTQAELFDVIRGEDISDNVRLFGGDAEVTGLMGGLIDFYAEYGNLNWDEEESYNTDLQDGRAFYSSVIAYVNAFTILAEYKDYKAWDYRYSRPPTADRDDEVADIIDIQGPRIKVDYFIPSTQTLLYVSLGRFDNHSPETSYGEVYRNRIDHIYGGIEQTWDDLYAHITYGYKDYITIDELHRRITSDFQYRISDRNSLNLYYEYKYYQIPTTEKNEHKSYLTYSLSPWFSATVHYNRHLIGFHSEQDEEWFAGEVNATPISALSITLLYGQLPTGLICSGGQCRIVPEFDGFQVSVTYRF